MMNPYRKTKIIALILAVIISLCIAPAHAAKKQPAPDNAVVYAQAQQMLAEGLLSDAQALFKSLKKYEESQKYAAYINARMLVQKGDFLGAQASYGKLSGFLDADKNAEILAEASLMPLSNSFRERSYKISSIKYGLMDSKGNQVTPFEWDYIHYVNSCYNSGTCRADVIDMKRDWLSDHPEGQMAPEHHVVSYIVYRGSMRENTYGFPVPPEEKAVGFGLINARGETLVSPIYGNPQWLSHGLAAFLNDDGKTVSLFALDKGMPPFAPVGVFDEVLGITDDDAKIPIATRTADRWQYVDRNGYPIGGTYDELRAFSNGFGAVCNLSSWGIVDASGALKIDCIYEDVGQYVGGALRVKENGQWRFITLEGAPAFAGTFEDAKDFSDGLAAVKTNGLWGFVDASGTMQIEPEYENVGNFQTHVHLAAIQKDGKWGHIDQSGKIIVKPQWDEDEELDYLFTTELVCLVKSEESYGLVNNKGKIVAKANHSVIYPVGEFLWIAINQKGTPVLYSSKGKVVLTYSLKNRNRFSWNINTGPGGSTVFERHFEKNRDIYSADYFNANGKRVTPKLLDE